MIWLPGYTQVVLGASGGPYDQTDNPKLCWHTTEGATLAGAETAFWSYPPHLGVDPSTGERHQYIPLDRRAYSLGNSDAEDSYCIQVEVVGRADQSHTWSDDRLEWLAVNVVRPVADTVGVPAVALMFYGEGDGYILASPDSPIRLSLADWDAYSGHVGHQHCPGDDHWDPGRLDLAAILAYAAADQPSDILKELPTVDFLLVDRGASYLVNTQSGFFLPNAPQVTPPVPVMERNGAREAVEEACIQVRTGR